MNFADQLKTSREEATKILFSKMHEKAIESTHEMFKDKFSNLFKKKKSRAIDVDDYKSKDIYTNTKTKDHKQPPEKILSLPAPKK